LVVKLVILVCTFFFYYLVCFVFGNCSHVCKIHTDPEILHYHILRKAAETRQLQLVFDNIVFYLDPPSFEVKVFELRFIEIKQICHQSLNFTGRQCEFNNVNFHIVIHTNDMTSERKGINICVECSVESISYCNEKFQKRRMVKFAACHAQSLLWHGYALSFKEIVESGLSRCSVHREQVFQQIMKRHLAFSCKILWLKTALGQRGNGSHNRSGNSYSNCK